MPGKDIQITERFAKVAPLIELRCEWTVGSLKKARAILVDMILHLTLPDTLHWVTVLNFEPAIEAQLLEHVSTLMHHKSFLKEDTWLLELTHRV
tara:strand:- start:6415 stop:6696 length:282 start_codon:yes stop_codon:yes gene_type:complete